MAVQLTLPMPTTGVTSEDEARVLAYVASIMPRGVPTYVRRVLNVTSDRYGFVARIELFDGGLCDVTITGPLGGAGYSWRFPDGGAPFGWEARRRKWVRYPKLKKADDG